MRFQRVGLIVGGVVVASGMFLVLALLVHERVPVEAPQHSVPISYIGSAPDCEFDGELARNVRDVIRASQSCTTDDDCTLLGACPFGCSIPVSTMNVPSVKTAIAQYRQLGCHCVYQCTQLDGRWAQCRDGVCRLSPHCNDALCPEVFLEQHGEPG